jgi:cyanate permease
MEETKKPYRWTIEILVYLGAIMWGMIMFCIGPMLIILTQELQVSFTKAALLAGIIAMLVGISALVSGAVSGRIGTKVTICLGITIMALGGIISGLVPKYSVVFAGRVLFGVGAGLFFPMMGAFIFQWFSDKELVVVNSINFSGATAGIAIAMLITTPVLEFFGWRMTLILYGAICGVIALLYWPLLKERSIAVSSVAQDTSQVGKSEMTASDVLKMKETWLLSFIFIAPVMASFAMATFLPALYVKERGMTMAAASSLTSITYFVGVPAAIIGGLWGAQLGLRKPILILNGIIMGIGCLGSVLLSGATPMLVSLILMGIGLLFYTGTFFTIPMELEGITPKAIGLMIGIITFMGFEAGFLMPVFIGWIENITGSLKTGLVTVSIIGFLLMTILPVFLKETGPKAKNRP